ncbi:hypothetical protein COJ48_21165 [Bacillus cereus]|nr:hypothetical protein COJ48_21165 [Bacillus cereus]PGP82581.1 hypothetical protein CN997_14300 [Bacillus cereus]
MSSCYILPYQILQMKISDSILKMIKVVPIIKKTMNEIDTIGIPFLDLQGKYLIPILKKDVMFFNLINKPQNIGRIILHLALPLKNSNQKLNTFILVLNATRAIDVNFQKGMFVLNFDINTNVTLIEKALVISPYRHALLLKDLHKHNASRRNKKGPYSSPLSIYMLSI